MYGKCGSVNEAVATFNNIQHKNMYTWSILTMAFTSNGYLLEGRELFDRNPYKNHVSWTAMVASYAQSGKILVAKALFDSIPVKTTAAWNAMITGYAEAGNLVSARAMFDLTPHKDLVSWNSMISAYSNSGDNFEDAKNLFDRAPQRNCRTWTSMLSAYTRSGQMIQGQNFFEKMPDTNLVSWTCLMTGYANSGKELDTLLTFKKMDQHGCQGDHTAFVIVIDACAKLGAAHEGVEIHEHLVHLGLATDVVLGSALVTFYGRCRIVDRALKVFERMPQRSIISWTAMISALAQNNRGQEAIQFFRAMEIDGTHPNQITLISVFAACSIVPDLALGSLLHSEILSELENSSVLATAVVNMYGKGGRLDLANQVFESCRVAKGDVVAWTAIITAYARNGLHRGAMELLLEMLLHGTSPNHITLLSLISTCDHSGNLSGGSDYFRLLLHECEIQPTMEHYVCMVDVLCRSGRMKEAEDLIISMPYEPHPMAWKALLSSSRISPGRCKSGVPTS